LSEEDFLEHARMKPADFTRNRGKLPFDRLMRIIMSLVRTSISAKIRRIFASEGADLEATQQSFCEAGAKIKWEAFERLFDATVELAYSGYFQTWHGCRVSAIDGSRIALPAADALRKAFGCQGPEKDAPTAQASIICDIYSQVVIDAEIDPLPTDGRTMAERRLDSLSGKGCSAREPFIFDRGYPPFDPMHKLESLGFTCAVRAPKNFNQDAAAQKEGDGRILLKRAGSDDMAARILKFDLESGEQEVPAANLFDERMGDEGL
jgi:hypothetical protein